MSNRASSSCLLEPPLSSASSGNGRKRESTGAATGHNGCPNRMGVGTPRRPAATPRNGDCIRIVIAHDQPVYRDGLRKLIESQPGLRVAGESSVGVEVVKLARKLKPDILLLDLGMRERSGLQILTDLAHLSPPVRTLILAAKVEEGSILDAFCLGAHGIVRKGAPRQVLLKSIRSVIAGQYWLDSESVSMVIEALRKFPPLQNGRNGGGDYGLTPRELKIVARIANGSSNKGMGQEFSISERTVKHHLTNIFDKLGVSSRLELAIFAIEHGLVSKAA
jgi:two-component system nitrate/nitrite response regulator NarL